MSNLLWDTWVSTPFPTKPEIDYELDTVTVLADAVEEWYDRDPISASAFALHLTLTALEHITEGCGNPAQLADDLALVIGPAAPNAARVSEVAYHGGPLTRILVTGSRTWEDDRLVREVLNYAVAEHGHHVVIVHGGCSTGADAIADRWARNHAHLGVRIEAHPADWETHGRAAGPLRNKHMVDLGAAECLTFIRDQSRGATHCANTAARAGIPVQLYTETSS